MRRRARYFYRRGARGRRRRAESLDASYLEFALVCSFQCFACPAGAQEAWSPFSRAPRDPIEQGRIDSANDPVEAINREIFKANKFFDDFILKPVARDFSKCEHRKA